MAGIGFRLRRLAQQGQPVQGFLGAAIISCGPWLVTIAALLLAQSIRSDDPNLDTFRAIVTYAYTFSLLYTSWFQNIVTRYLADRIHEEDYDCHWPSLTGVSLISLPGAWLLGAVLFLHLPLDGWQRFQAALLLVLISQNWLNAIFVGAARAHRWIVFSFVAGALCTWLASFPWPLLSAFLVGQGVTAALLVHCLRLEFPAGKQPWDFRWLHYAGKFRGLWVSGVLIQLGIWAGVLTYWHSPQATTIAGLRVFARHDLCMFIGMLSTVPSVTLFFLQTETSFYEAYRDFFFGILAGKVRLTDLQFSKGRMQRVLLSSMARLLRVQMLFTAALIFYSREVLWICWLPEEWSLTLQLAAGGALALVLFQCSLVILYYYELYRQSMWVSLGFCLSHLGLAQLTLRWGPDSFGFGLLIASLVGFGWSIHLIRRHLEGLEFYTFMQQPMPGTLSSVKAGEEFSSVVRSQGQWLVEWSQT